MKIQVDVTRDDIKRAREIRKAFDEHKEVSYWRAECCPIALALRRCDPMFSNAYVYGEYVRLRTGDEPTGKKIDLPADAMEFVRQADKSKDKNVKPFSFTLEIDEPK